MSRSELCDGIDDCLDGSDEDYASCVAGGKFSCELTAKFFKSQIQTNFNLFIK